MNGFANLSDFRCALSLHAGTHLNRRSFCPERALCCRHYGHLWSRSRGLMIWSRSRGLMIWSRRQQGRLSFWLYSVCILSVLVMTVLLYPPYNRQASYQTKISWTMHPEKTELRPTGAISFI